MKLIEYQDQDQYHYDPSSLLLIEDILDLCFYSKEIKYFLDIIACCEGTANLKNIEKTTYKPSLDEYRQCFGYQHTIYNFDMHPGKKGFKGIIKKNLELLASTASGRYQFLLRTWQDLLDRWLHKKNKKKIIKYIKNNVSLIEKNYEKNIAKMYEENKKIEKNLFGPIWQDIGAIILLYEANALPSILSFDFKKAIVQCCQIWASFPCTTHKRSNKSFYKNQNAFNINKILSIINKKYKMQ